VLDNHNAQSSPVLTVIPLTSVKDNKEIHNNNVELGNELYRLLKIKYDTINQSLKEEQTEIATTLQVFASLISLSSNTAKELAACDKGSNEFSQKLLATQQYLEDAASLQATWEKKKKHNQAELEYLNKIGQEISQMKEGSIALINQITTVSKIRIFDPRNLKGVLSGISLSEESMIKINNKLKELYVFN
jgi:small-conductance mechanosensitive channel